MSWSGRGSGSNALSMREIMLPILGIHVPVVEVFVLLHHNGQTLRSRKPMVVFEGQLRVFGWSSRNGRVRSGDWQRMEEGGVGFGTGCHIMRRGMSHSRQFEPHARLPLHGR